MQQEAAAEPKNTLNFQPADTFEATLEGSTAKRTNAKQHYADPPEVRQWHLGDRQVLLGLLMYIGSTIFNSGVSLCAKLLGKRCIGCWPFHYSVEYCTVSQDFVISKLC